MDRYHESARGPRRGTRRPYRRPPKNPAGYFLGIIMLACVTAVFIIVSRSSKPLVAVPKKPTAQKQPEEEIYRKVEALKRSSLPPEEALYAAEDLRNKAARAETQQVTSRLVRFFAEKTAAAIVKKISKEKATIAQKAESGDFAGAQEAIAKLRKRYALFLSRPYPAVATVEAALQALEQVIQEAKEKQFAVDFAALQAAVAAEDLDGANTLVEKIYRYGTDIMKRKADAAVDPLFRKIRSRELAGMIRAKKALQKQGGPASRVSRSPAYSPPAEPQQPSETETQEVGQVEPPAEESQGENTGEPFEAAGVLVVDPKRGYELSERGGKTPLRFAKSATLLRDTSIPPKKFMQVLTPGAPVLFLGERVTFALTNDAAEGRRLRNVELALLGQGWPQAPSWQDPKRPKLLWLKGSFVRITPPPPLFLINGNRYIMLGLPRYVVWRERVEPADFVRGKYRVYVEGTKEDQPDGKSVIICTKLIGLPAGKVLKFPAYRALLLQQ